MWRRVLGDSTPIDGRLLSLFALIAFIGGGVKAVIHRNERTGLKDVIAAAVASSLSGFGVGSALLYAWGPDKVLLIFPIVAVSGWIGMVLLDFAAGYAMGRVNAWQQRQDLVPTAPAPTAAATTTTGAMTPAAIRPTHPRPPSTN
jgi:hypothetical protein